MFARLFRKTALGLDVAGHSHVGQVRENNEDSWAGQSASESSTSASGYLVVADGMGGRLAGEVASKMAVEEVDEASQSSSITDPESMQGLFRRINHSVHTAGQRASTSGMGTTLTVGVQSGRRLLVGHVGDSRLYLIRRRKITQITSDHNVTAEKLAAGFITADEALQDPQRNILTRAIGAEPHVECDIYELTLKRGDRLLACSDGLYGDLSDEVILDLASQGSPNVASQALVTAANSAGGMDNITAIVADAIPVKRTADTSQASPEDAKTINVNRDRD